MLWASDKRKSEWHRNPKNIKIMWTKGTCCWVDWYSRSFQTSTSQSILCWHYQNLINSQLIVGRLLRDSWINLKLVDFQLTVGQDVDVVLIHCQPRCQWGVNWVAIKGISATNTYSAQDSEHLCQRLHHLYHFFLQLRETLTLNSIFMCSTCHLTFKGQPFP